MIRAIFVVCHLIDEAFEIYGSLGEFPLSGSLLTLKNFSNNNRNLFIDLKCFKKSYQVNPLKEV